MNERRTGAAKNSDRAKRVLGVEGTKHTVPIYSETDHKWYSYTRVFTYAIDGRLYKMTAATKQTVHEPVAHSTL